MRGYIKQSRINLAKKGANVWRQKSDDGGDK